TRFSRDWSSDVCSSDLLKIEKKSIEPQPCDHTTQFWYLGHGFRNGPWWRFPKPNWGRLGWADQSVPTNWAIAFPWAPGGHPIARSEERRVGKESGAVGQ